MANAQKPDNVHQLNGTYRKDRHGDPDTKPEWNCGLPDMPDYLDEYAQTEWKRIIKAVPAGVITKTDRTLLIQYCVLAAYLEHHARWTIKDDCPPPSFSAADHTQLRLLQQELGFTPISRGKIGGVPKDHSKDGPQPIPR